MTDRTSHAIGNTPRIKLVVEGAGWARNHSSTSGAVTTGWARYKFEIGRPWLAVVAWWAILANGT